MGGVRNIMVRAGADFSQLSHAMQQAQRETSVFGNNMEGIFTRIGLVGQGIKTVFEGIAHAVEGVGEFAQQAAELDGRLSSLNARLGQSAQQFQQWAQANGNALGLSNKDMIEQGASISAMLETSISDKQQLATQTEQMLKNIAIVSAATGKSQQEVSERVVSALQGHSAAVAALDLNMKLSALKSSEAYKQIAGNEPWTKLTAAQQQMIIVTEMNAQVQQRFGSNVVEDTATRMNRFTAALSNVKTSLEQAFQPILFRVLPILTTFINYINTALQYVTAFFQTLFGYSGVVMKAVTGDISDQTDAVNGLSGAYDNLNKSTGTTAKKSTSTGGVSIPKVKTGGIGSTSVGGGKKVGTGFLASFDQIHSIPEASKAGGTSGAGAGSSGGVGAGAAGVPNIGTGLEQGANKGSSALSGLQNKIKGWVDAVKNFLAPVGKIFKEIWDAIASYFKGVVNGLIKWWNQWGGIIVQAMKNAWALLSPIIVYLVQFIWDSIKGAINGLIKFFEGLIEFLSGIFTGNWKAVFKGLWDMIKGGLQAVWNILSLVFLTDGIGAIKDFATMGLKAVLGFFEDGMINAKSFLSDITGGFKNLWNWLKNAFSDIGLTFYRVFDGMFHRGLDLWNGLIDGARMAVSGIKNFFSSMVNWFIRSVIQPIVNHFQSIVNGFTTGGLVGGLKAIINTWIDYLDNFINMTNKVIHLIPGVSVSIPTIPHLANGGITNGAMLAMIGDNIGGKEVVTPLDRLQGMIASTVTQTINTVNSMQKGKGNTATGDIILSIDGRQFARIIKPYQDLEQKRLGTNIRLQTL